MLAGRQMAIRYTGQPILLCHGGEIHSEGIGKIIYPSQSSGGVPAGSRAEDNPWYVTQWTTKLPAVISTIYCRPSVEASRQNLSLAVTSSLRSRILHKKFHSVRSSPTVLGTTQCPQCAARREHLVEMAQLRS